MQDHVSLLTQSEYDALSEDAGLVDKLLYCVPTDYTKSLNCYKPKGINSTSWWLRADIVTKGKTKQNGKYMYNDLPWVKGSGTGSKTGGQSVTTADNSVRPVIWVKLSWLESGR